jgi:NifU homolog involved in Fe-S cluster formation
MIPEIEELYQEVILDHSRRPRNFGELPDAAVLVHGDNPACGDEIHLAVKFNGGGAWRISSSPGTDAPSVRRRHH